MATVLDDPLAYSPYTALNGGMGCGQAAAQLVQLGQPTSLTEQGAGVVAGMSLCRASPTVAMPRVPLAAGSWAPLNISLLVVSPTAATEDALVIAPMISQLVSFSSELAGRLELPGPHKALLPLPI